MSEYEEQVEREEEEGAPLPSTLEDDSKEAIREAVEASYDPPALSESIGEEAEEPAGEEMPAGEGMPAEEGISVEEAPLLDLNAATQKELSSLPGIGLTLAGRIVSYREQAGPFRKVAEITHVQGIAGATYEAIADRITVGSVPPEEVEEVMAEGVALPPPEEVEDRAVGAGPEVEAVAEEGPFVIPLATEEEEPGEAPLPDFEEEEAVAPEKVAPAPPPPPEVTRYEPPRRGVSWGSVLIVGLLSALGGALLALLVLFLLNGSNLDFQRATTRAIDREMSQVDGRLADLQAQLDDARRQLAQVGELSQQLGETQTTLSEARSDIETLGGAVGAIESDLASATKGLADVRQTLAGLSDDFTSLAETVTTLDEQVADVEDRLANMGELVTALRRATNRFDTFLYGLRGLLEEAAPEPTRPAEREQTPTPTPWITRTPPPRMTPTPTPAGPTATPASQVTVIPLASPTP